MMEDSAATILPSSVGYGVVIGVGSFFTLVMIGISMLQVGSTTISVHRIEVDMTDTH